MPDDPHPRRLLPLFVVWTREELEAATASLTRACQARWNLVAIVLILWHWGLRNRAEAFSSIVDKQWTILVKTMQCLHLDIRTEAVSTAALCKSRQSTGTAPFVALHSFATEKHLRQHHLLLTYKRYRLWAVDGSSFNLASNSLLDQAFGRPTSTGKRKAPPQASFVALELVNTGWITDYRLARWDAGETTLAREITAKLDERDLLLADRLHFNPPWFADLCRRHVKFLFRLNCNRHRSLTPESQSKITVLRLKGSVDCRVDLKVKTSYGHYELLKNLRYIEHKRPGAGTLYLITNLDENEVSLCEAVELYRMRWEIETTFRFFKGQNHLSAVRSRREDTVRQEVLLHLLAHNSVRFIQSEACLANTQTRAPADNPNPPATPPLGIHPLTADNVGTPSDQWTAKYLLHNGRLRPVDLQFNRTVDAVLGYIVEELLFPEASQSAWTRLLKKVASLKISAKPGRAFPRYGRKYDKRKRKKGNRRAQGQRARQRKMARARES